MRIKADLTLLFVSIIWGSAFAAQRIAANAGSVYFFNGFRFILAALVLIPFIKNLTFLEGQLLWMFISGGILFLGSALQQAGMLTTTAGNAGFITTLYVVIVPLLVFAGWREKPNWLSIIAVGLAAYGAYLLSTAGRYIVRTGDWLELAGAFFWALHVILLGKIAPKYNFLVFAAGQYIVAGLLNTSMGFWWRETANLYSLELIASILYTALFSVSIGYTLQVWAQRHTPPMDAALILSLEAVFAGITGWLILQETLEPIQVAGCGLILIAVILAQARQWGFR